MNISNDFNIKYIENLSVMNFANVELENLIFLDVFIDGESYPFLFDTGANIIVINEDILVNKDENQWLFRVGYNK